MPKIDLGRTGAAVSPADDGFVETAVELERLGFSTIWIPGGPMAELGQLAQVVRATQHVRVASGIIPVIRFGAGEVAALYEELEAEHPGRFIVGLGGAHGPNPLGTLNAYLDQLETTVPATARVMAALGPKMLELARDRTSAAFPVHVSPEYTRQARHVIGDDTTLAVEQVVVLETDAQRARQTVREHLEFFLTVPAYQASFRRQGFTDGDVSQISDRLVDALVAWGDPAAIAARVAEHREAGADHVAVTIESSTTPTLDQWRQLADALITS